MPNLNLLRVLRATFPSARIAVEAMTLDQHAPPLLPAEAAQVSNWTLEARAQFAGGRYCVRRAMAGLGMLPVELLRSADGSPAWPVGIVGSISHKQRACVAVVARSQTAASLGVDIELCEPGEAWWSEVCTDDELHWIRAAGRDEQSLRATLVFSAKESFYKAQYPLTRDNNLDFDDVAVKIDLSAGTFLVSARPAVMASTLATDTAGRFGITGPLVCTGVEVASRAAKSI